MRGIQLPTSIPETANHNPASFEGEQPTQLVSAATDYDDNVELVLNLNKVIANAEALEPTLIAKARHRPEWPQWEQGIRKELTTLQKAGTWELVDPPQGVNIVGSKWVFCAKKDAACNVVRYKACLVAQGFSQVPGVDYFDTYAPVAKLASICTVLALATQQNLKLH